MRNEFFLPNNERPDKLQPARPAAVSRRSVIRHGSMVGAALVLPPSQFSRRDNDLPLQKGQQDQLRGFQQMATLLRTKAAAAQAGGTSQEVGFRGINAEDYSFHLEKSEMGYEMLRPASWNYQHIPDLDLMNYPDGVDVFFGEEFPGLTTTALIYNPRGDGGHTAEEVAPETEKHIRLMQAAANPDKHPSIIKDSVTLTDLDLNGFRMETILPAGAYLYVQGPPAQEDSNYIVYGFNLQDKFWLMSVGTIAWYKNKEGNIREKTNFETLAHSIRFNI